MVCMNGKVVLSRGLIHYLAGNHAKKMTWQAGGLRVLCLRHAQMEDDPCGDRSHTSEVIASRVATTDFAASSTKGDPHDECRTAVPCVPARPTRRCRGQWSNWRLARRRCGFPRKLVGVASGADELAGIKQTDATDERRGTCLRKRCSGLASALASLPGVSQLNTSGRYSAPRRAGMPCVLSSSCTV